MLSPRLSLYNRYFLLYQYCKTYYQPLHSFSHNTFHPTYIPDLSTFKVAATDPGSDDMEAMAYPIDFIMNVELQTKNGSDLPLNNTTLEIEEQEDDGSTWPRNPFRHPSIKHYDNHHTDEYNFEKEDYWLFYVRLKAGSELEIAIGGEKSLFVTSRPNWNRITDRDEYEQEVKNDKGQLFDLSWKFDNSLDRFVAVRAPKMDNPAISLRVQHGCGAIYWVGLFAKTGINDTNHFIAIRTTNRLLPQYAERSKNHPDYKDWYSQDGPVNIHDCVLTMFPKQLYGTTTNSPQLYRQFVSQDPYNKIGSRHFEYVLAATKDWLSPWPKRYTWAAHGTTWIRIRARGINNTPNIFPDKWLDYISGVMLKDTVANKGWAVLLEMFGSMLQILKGVLSVSVAEIVGGVINLGEAIFNEEKMHREADVKGFITSITEAIDAGNKRRKDGKTKQVEKPNTTNILVLIQRIEAGNYSPRDMGTRSMQMG